VAPHDYTAAKAAAMTVNPVEVWQRDKTQPPLGPTDVVNCKASLFTDVRLVIGPTTGAEGLGPLFETRSYVELSTDGRNRPLTFPLALFPLYARNDAADGQLNDYVGSVAAQFDDGWRRITGIGREGWTGDAFVAGEMFGVWLDSGLGLDPLLVEDGAEAGVHEWTVNWHAVSPSTVNQLMQLLTRVGWGLLRMGPPGRWLCELVGPYQKHTMFRFLGKRCQEFETALYSGAIETGLAEQCRRIAKKLEEHIAEAKAARDRETADLLARWRKTD
jgi:hypothetical protein